MGSGAQGEAGGWTIRQQIDLIAKLGLDGLAGRDIK